MLVFIVIFIIIVLCLGVMGLVDIGCRIINVGKEIWKWGVLWGWGMLGCFYMIFINSVGFSMC